MYRYVLVYALLLRVVAVFWWQNALDVDESLFRFGDSDTYWVLASKIAHGQSYEYGSPDSRVFRAPLYPIFLAPFTLLDSKLGVWAARLAGAILGTFSVWLVMLATRKLSSDKAAVCAGFLAASYPGAIGMSIFVLSEAVFCPLMLLSIFFFTRSLGEVSEKNGPAMPNSLSISSCLSSEGKIGPIGLAFVAGMFCGLGCLARPSWFLWPVCLGSSVAIFALRNSWPTRRQRISAAYTVATRLLAYCLGGAIAMSPWWWRNYEITGRFVPTTLQVGASLYDGLHAGASGGSDEGMAFCYPFEDALRREYADSLQNQSGLVGSATAAPKDVFEWELNRRLLDAAWRWANKNRSAAFRLALVKFLKMWSPWPTAKEVGGFGVRIAESTAYIAILVCAAIAFWAIPTQRRTLWLYVLPTVYFAALHLVFASSVRYRQPAILVMCVVAGIGAAWMLDRIKQQSLHSRTGKP